MRARPLRPWQTEAASTYERMNADDFLVTATPGSGKTTFGLHVAQDLLRRRIAQRIIVVTPTDHLRAQWADAAAEMGIALDPTLPNSVGPVPAGFDGYVATYAQVAAKPILHRRRTELGKAVVLLDEIHHCADGEGSSWGEAVLESFEPARRRISLTGTPFRTRPHEQIPFVNYQPQQDGTLESVADYEYGYRKALNDAVVRPVVFAAYTGVSRWLNSAGEVISSQLGTGTKKDENSAWRTALDPKGQWIPHVIAAADQRLSDVRASGMPDAGALLLASDQETARAYARIVKRVTGTTATVVLSDDRTSDKKLAAFAVDDTRWVIAVQMISEGVDIPRLAVLVWATAYRTPLFFAQAVGRVVRARSPQETATVFLPAVRPLLALAAELEEQRNHVVAPPPPAEGEIETQDWQREPGESPFTALDAQAEFAHLLHDGRAIVPDAPGATESSSEEEEFLGLPGLLTPEQTAQLLASRDNQTRKQATLTLDIAPASSDPEVTDWRDRQSLRKELNRLVSVLAARTKTSHGQIHARARKAVPGPPSASASPDIIAARCDYLEQQIR
jgi:superfamily II DNA or RNA helicase